MEKWSKQITKRNSECKKHRNVQMVIVKITSDGRIFSEIWKHFVAGEHHSCQTKNPTNELVGCVILGRNHSAVLYHFVTKSVTLLLFYMTMARWQVQSNSFLSNVKTVGIYSNEFPNEFCDYSNTVLPTLHFGKVECRH